MGSIKIPAKECHLRKVFAYSNKAHPNVMKTTVEPALHAAAKTKCTKKSRGSRLRMCDSSKVRQKVSAFGPAHAEQLRKLYHVKETRNEESQTGYNVSKRFSHQFGRHILISNDESAQRVYHTSSFAKRVSSIRNECYTESEKRVQHSLMLKPLVRIATIQQRPDGKSVSKPKHSLDIIECNVHTNEGFVKEERLKCEDKIGQKCTIFQLLGEMSSLSI